MFIYNYRKIKILEFNKIIKFLVLIILLNSFTSVKAIESSSVNYSISEANFSSSNQSNSTNYSLYGSISNEHKGFFTSASLPLIPGIITSCGKITSSGTYTLGVNLINVPTSCFIIQANNVIIDGAGFSVTASNGNTNYAVIATSTTINGGSAYGTTTIQNINFLGFTGGINANGNNSSSGNMNGGNAGSISVSSSTLGNIVANGGSGFGNGETGLAGNIVINNSITGNITSSGVGGSIYISAADLDISNKTYITNGIFNISYINSLTTINTNLSSLQSLVINNVNQGSYIGGLFPLVPGIINSCENLYFQGIYTLGSDIIGNCNIANNGILIEGNGHIINGNITANNYGVTLSSVDVTGTVSTTGAGAGSLILNNASNLIGNISVTGIISGDGSSSLGDTIINSGGSVATSSVSFVHNVINNGTINSGNTVLGKITNNSVINSTLTTFTLNTSSINTGTINGNALFNTSSINTGTINGNATFNSFTAIDGSVSFDDSTAFVGIGYVSGNVYDSLGNNINTWVFNASSTNTGILKGNAIFNDTSINTVSAIVQGNAIFNNSSRNLGVVTGNSDAYSPVIRPLTGITNGQVIYHNYAGLYFNDTALGHGVVGKWDDMNNWWIDVASTIHAPVLPTSGDDVIILFGNINSSSITAFVKTIIFQNSTNNSITIILASTSTDAALFNTSSTNTGTIIGNATFSGPDTNNTGTVTGYITRKYDAGTYTVLTDFTHNGVHWIIEAVNGATVNLVNATYSLTTNIFKAFNNAVFVWNDLIGGGAPDLSIVSPTAGTNIKWKPNISWGTSVLCQYKIDGGNYTSVNCSKKGSDIVRPSAGLHTIFFRSSDGKNITEKTIILTYDNTQPIDTDCSTPLDENTRPYYYLTSNVTNCSITASTTLRGDDNGGGHFYTIENITGSGTNIILQNITATGIVSGFNNINISSSTLSGSISVAGILTADNVSVLNNATINNDATVLSGRFIGDVVNNGIITNSTTTPVTILGSLTNNGTINNGFIFNSTSTNNGTVNGTTTLNNNSLNQGIINGDLIFNTLTSISNAVTFSNNINFLGTGNVSGNIFDNRGVIINSWIFRDLSTNIGLIKGEVFFNDSSTNAGTVSGNAHFSDSSTNAGVITGNADKYNSALISSVLTGTVNGNITYHSYVNSPSFRNISGDNNWNNLSNWFAFAATTSIPLGRLPQNNENIVLFASTTLIGDLVNDIYIAFSSTTLNGANHRVTGNIYGDGAYGGFDAYNFDLENIIVTGTTTAIGGDGNPNVDGGNGGNVNVKNSSTGPIVVNGGDPLHNGGDAGTITVINTIAVAPNTPIMSIGGNSVGCGFGGSGGNVSLIDSSDYVLITAAGADATTTVAQGGGCVNPPVGRSGGTGQVSIVGKYNTVTNNTNIANKNTIPAYYSSTILKIKPKNILDRIIPIIDFGIKISPFKLKTLPIFGDGTNGTFTFTKGLMNLISTPIPKDVLNNFKSSPNLLSSLNIKNMNDLFALRYKSSLIKNTKVKGLFTSYSISSLIPINSYVSFETKNTLTQSIKVKPNQKLIITVLPMNDSGIFDGKFDNKDINFVNNKINITTPSRGGTYRLSTSATPIILKIQVIGSNEITYIEDQTTNVLIKVINWVKNLFKRYSIIQGQTSKKPFISRILKVF